MSRTLTEVIPCITIWQPWATLIAEEVKVWEFRGNRTTTMARNHVGQRIGIHAGSRRVRRQEIADLMEKLTSGRSRETGIVAPGRALDLLERMFDAPDLVPRSVVLCTCILAPPQNGAALARALDIAATKSSMLDWTNWGWPLSGVRRLQPPIPARGARGFWSCHMEIQSDG